MYRDFVIEGKCLRIGIQEWEKADRPPRKSRSPLPARESSQSSRSSDFLCAGPSECVIGGGDR